MILLYMQSSYAHSLDKSEKKPHHCIYLASLASPNPLQFIADSRAPIQCLDARIDPVTSGGRRKVIRTGYSNPVQEKNHEH